MLRAYRATPPTAPFNQLADAPPLGLAHWRDPDAIDMRRHVLRSTLPAPGTIAQLNERLAELHQGMLDRRRPLFEIHLIDGLESGRFALYVKSHHVSWDGRSAMARIFGSFSREPGPILAGFHAAPAAVDDGGTADTGLAHNLRTLVSQAMAMRELYANVAKRIGALRGDPDRPRGNTPFAGPHTRFNQPVTAERTLGQFTLPLEELRRVGRAHGGTINDVLLAIVDDGVHRYLRDLGEPPPAAAGRHVSGVLAPAGRPRGRNQGDHAVREARRSTFRSRRPPAGNRREHDSARRPSNARCRTRRRSTSRCSRSACGSRPTRSGSTPTRSRW